MNKDDLFTVMAGVSGISLTQVINGYIGVLIGLLTVVYLVMKILNLKNNLKNGKSKLD